MRATLNRRRLAYVAAAASSLALLAACGQQPRGASPAATPTRSPITAPLPAQLTGLAAGDLLISDGTDAVTIGDRRVTFPSAVTDASWSPDGSRIVFVDSEQNISTARADGSGRVVLTRARAGVVRSRPVWFPSGLIGFDERGGTGPVISMTVSTLPPRPDAKFEEYPLDNLFGNDGRDVDHGVSAAVQSGPNHELAYIHQAGNVAEVWVADTNARSPYGQKLTLGTDAALSPDGTKVAIVDQGHISVVDARKQNPKPVRITFGIAGPTHLAWSPDGKTIAFSTDKDIQSVSATVPSGATSNPAHQVSDRPGTPSFLPAARDKLMTLNQPDPVLAAIALSKSRYATVTAYGDRPDQRSAGTATLVSTADPALALAYGASQGGPLLFTNGSTLDPRSKAELVRIFGVVPTDPQILRPEILLVGDASVISKAVENTLTAMRFTVVRANGHDLRSVSDASAKDHFMTGGWEIAVASADNQAGQALALAVNPFGALIATDGHLSATGRAAVKSLNKDMTLYALDDLAAAALTEALSGSGSAHAKVVTAFTPEALYGSRAYGVRGAVLAPTGSDVDIALAVSYASWGGLVALVVPESGCTNDTLNWLASNSGLADEVTVVDAHDAVRPSVQFSVANAVSGPLSYSTATLPDLR